VRDWIYSDDHSKAIDLILGEGRTGEIYNISAGNELTNVALIRKVLKIMDKSEDLITFVEDRPGHDLRYSLNSDKVRKEFNWEPKHDLLDSLHDTIDWYRENEWWWKHLATEAALHPTPWKN